MPFTGNEDHSISLEDAAALTKRHREGPVSNPVLGSYFSKTFLLTILDQSGCVGIRLYYGLDGSDKPTLVITGVTSDMDDIYDGVLAEHASDCPPYCPKSNPLNS